MNQQQINLAIRKLDAWLQGMRNAHGFTGPIAHWWETCLLYSGTMIDWRYEGILCGYVNLFRATRYPVWLHRAIEAGDDILGAQLPSGKFANSSFQQGPIEGGTPHEAAVDVGLLELARLLKERGDERWYKYYVAAERNIEDYLLAQLWSGQAFLDQPWNTTYVPNKNATILEALLLYEEFNGRSMEEYIRSAARVILNAQVHQLGSRSGATVHLGTGKHHLAIGIYTARCAAALIRLYQHYPDESFVSSARAMLAFLLRLLVQDGTLFGIYRDGRPIQCPTWISPSGDILRAFLTMQPYTDVPLTAIDQLTSVLIEHQLPSGGIPSSRGLARKGSTKQMHSLPDFRDVLPVVGWCDKTFRALTMLVKEPQELPTTNLICDASIHCRWKGQTCVFIETTTSLSLSKLHNGRLLYDWSKGSCYPSVYQL